MTFVVACIIGFPHFRFDQGYRDVVLCKEFTLISVILWVNVPERRARSNTAPILHMMLAEAALILKYGLDSFNCPF